MQSKRIPYMAVVLKFINNADASMISVKIASKLLRMGLMNFGWDYISSFMLSIATTPES